MLELNSKNYFSLEAERDYLSCSQYMSFLECEARTMAKIRGEWVEPKSTPLLVGSYLHSHFESPQAKREFIADTPEMFKKDGSLKADYLEADRMIETLENDEYCMYLLQGESEVIITAEIFGLPWKIKLDKLLRDKRRIVDIKTTKGINEKDWVVRDGQNVKVSFVEAFNYPLRAAVYCEIERIASGREVGDWFNFYIVAVSKEDPPDKAVIDMSDPYRFAEELAKIEGSLLRIRLLKAGTLQPMRCEKCAYCRSTKKLDKVIKYSDL